MKTYALKAPTLALLLASTAWLLAQQPATPQSILTAALTNMGAANLPGLTLSGNAELIAGSTDDTGSFTASCATNGSSQLQLQLSSASVTETRTTTGGIPAGQWVDSQGQQHTMAGQNLLTPESWFCPGIFLSEFIQNASVGIQFVGDETKNGATVAHFTIASIVPASTPHSALLTHMSNTDIYLDPTTLRPVAIDFNIHPDSNATIDIPVEILFSNYTNVGGTWIPFTVQKYINSTLALTLQVGSASASV